MEIPEHLHGMCADILDKEWWAAERKGLWAVILGLVPFKDGNQWCVLYGANLQEGIAGFGDSPAQAMYAFQDEFHRNGAQDKCQITCHTTGALNAG